MSEEFIRMDELKRARNVSIDAEVSAHLLHFVFVCNDLERYGSAKLQHLKLAVACLSYIAVHVDLVIVILLHLDDERFIGCVFIAFEFGQELLRRR